MQDLAALLSDILSYMTAGWRSRSRSMRWLVRGVTVALAVGLVWIISPIQQAAAGQALEAYTDGATRQFIEQFVVCAQTIRRQEHNN